MGIATSTWTRIGEHSQYEAFWAIPILFYGFGDILTTLIGLRMQLATEAAPISALLIETHGAGFIYVTKICTLGLFYFLWKAVPHPHRIGIPIGLSLVGIAVTGWNIGVIFMRLL